MSTAYCVARFVGACDSTHPPHTNEMKTISNTHRKERYSVVEIIFAAFQVADCFLPLFFVCSTEERNKTIRKKEYNSRQWHLLFQTANYKIAMQLDIRKLLVFCCCLCGRCRVAVEPRAQFVHHVQRRYVLLRHQ